MKKITVILVLLLSIACSEKNRINFPKKVEIRNEEFIKRNALKINSGDSLKRKAVQFIVTNLKYQTSYFGPKYQFYNKVIREFYHNEDSMIRIINTFKGSIPEDIISYDLLFLKNEDALFQDIDATYKLFNQTKWKDKVPFEIFCEFVLPYKINKTPFFDSWRLKLQKEYFKAHDSSLFRSDLVSATRTVHKWVYSNKNKFRLFYGNQHLLIPDLPAELLDKLYVGSCHEITALAVAYMRALGIPSAIDFVPKYLNMNNGHEWNAVIIDSLHCIPFDITADSLNKIKKESILFAKVYRRRFSPSEQSHFALRGLCKFLPPLFNDPFIDDVTTQYTTTTSLNIPVRESISFKTKFAYLCVFDKQANSWTPIGWGKIKGKKVIFEGVGRGGIYLAVSIEKGGTIALNSPFLLDNKGNIRFYTPDLTNLESVKLLRKYRSDIFKDEQKERMIGGLFQGSNSPNFNNVKNLYKVEENPGEHYNNITINDCKEEFRYVRYLSPKNSFGNIAEIEFYESNNCSALKGKVIGTKGSYQNAPTCTKEAAFDGNPLTYFDSKIIDYSWVGLDLGKKSKIDKIRFIARNDMNGVQIGNLYELFYWNNGWISLGEKRADTNYVIYKNVPKNSILWLRNLTEGQEERIFTYENGKQIWW